MPNYLTSNDLSESTVHCLTETTTAEAVAKYPAIKITTAGRAMPTVKIAAETPPKIKPAV